MPGMMPPGSIKPPEDDLPDFDADFAEEDDFERVEAQEDLDAAASSKKRKTATVTKAAMKAKGQPAGT